MKILHYADCNTLSFLVPWLGLMKGLSSLGVDQALLCRPGGDVSRIAREHGIETYTWKPVIAGAPILNPQYAALVRGIRPDIVHTRLSSAAGIAGRWGRFTGIPTIATFDKPAKGKYYARVDRYISCAEWLKKYMVEHSGLAAEKIDVVYNSVDVAKYARDEAERKKFRVAHGIGDDEKIFSGLGIYIPRKGFDILIRAFAAVSRERENLRLMLIGDGEERANYIALATSLGVADRIIMPEKFVADVRPWLWASDYYVMPSREEGFSIALLEVLASGLPVIVSDIPPFTEIIENGSNGLVSIKDDPDSFARAMNEMLAVSGDALAAMTGRCLDMMRHNFTNEAIARKTVDVYEKTLKTKQHERA
ncbi:glycosyltransferase family 4 protein [Synergistaceae bacterium OttesenSCG-928-I11]|nr:glycosyltransferase family 4 protein [Synergistaceae bacterium OttesenSCG-928-I11]